MAISTATDILDLIASQFASNPDKQDFIDLADRQIKKGLCGDRRPELVAFLAAHYLTLAQRGGASGTIDSMSEGQLSISYSHSNAEYINNSLDSTSYGQEYDRLSKQCILAIRTRVV